MSNPSALGQILYEIEAVHGEAVNTYATLQLPIVGAVDCSGLKQDKMDSQRAMAYRQGGTQYLLGPMGGSFKTKLYLTGHGSTTAGATTVNAIETLLGYVFGNATVSAAAGTTSSAGTATAPTTAASATFAAGALAKIGQLGDGKGNGQFAAIGTHIATALTLLTAIDAAPTAADVVYSAVNIYPSESPTATTIQPLRFQLMTANLVYQCHGCYPMSATISGTNYGEFLAIEIEWGVSWFTEAVSTFPSVVVSQRDNGAPNAGGSIFINDVGVAARVKRTNARSLSITYKLSVLPLPGGGGVSPFQTIVGARRLVDEIMVSWTEDAPAQTATPPQVIEATATVAKHILATMTTSIGSSVGFYFPNVVVTERPVQMNEDGANRLRFTGRAFTGLTTTSDLTLSAMRMAFA